ncbi:MAG: bifunctional [Burkholderiaceae bacterium]|nr:bifunctional [glutamate--ammonia ligase]-adenylyl-L-tyrosine phosphorylase/[glutamate--ammonia-ligase] adenylyltransferase [Burkholderiaceae bacterium]
MNNASGTATSLSNFEFFEKLAKKIIPALSDLSGAGFVFRVDMRLRPNGDSGPIVISSDMLEEYLYVQGREWERFAWLKGRVVSSPVFASDTQYETQKKNLAAIVRPFVFRKYVDFNAISALSDLHKLIRAETVRREAGRDRGINVKLGRGGIREIEFITQTFQVIRGGRDPQLRGKKTLDMLPLLAQVGAIKEEQAERLCEHYIFLRNLEHAIQYVDDQQTHRLPNTEEQRAPIAAMMGMDINEMVEKLEAVRDYVAETFDSIFQVQADEAEEDDWPQGWLQGFDSAFDPLVAIFTEKGFTEPQQAVHRVMALMSSKMLAAQSASARSKMAQLVKRVFELATTHDDQIVGVGADQVFLRFVNLLDVIAGRSTYVSLLCQYPAVTERVARFLATSAWAAEFLTRHPIILDELVDERSIVIDNDTVVDWSGWKDDVWKALQAVDGDQESQMNIIRDSHHGAVFRLLVADLEGRLTVERLADQLSALADAVIEIVITLAWQTIGSRHRDVPRFAVVAYGKLGGKELGYSSDLDLIYLFDDEDMSASKNYTRLVRRMMSWLTVQTSSGILFDVDLRLRPNGENGLVVSSLDMFKRYQRNEDGTGAWPWEHQALTRARFCAGDREIGEAFERERAEILCLPRIKEEVFTNVVDMRQKMLEGHGNPTRLFDLKHDRGGMVDVEFAVQALVLAYSHEHPELINNFGNIRLLSMAADAGLIEPAVAERAAAAYRRYRAIQRTIRLERGDIPARVDFAMVADEIAAVKALWVAIFGDEGPQRG